MNHFKLEFDIKCKSDDIQILLEIINKNIYNELKDKFEENIVQIMPTITKLDK